MPVLVVSMMFHELAHGFRGATRLGDPTAKRMGRLSFNPLKHMDPLGTAMFFITYLFGGFVFGWAKPVPVSPYYFKSRQWGMALVSLAGPVTNFVFAIVFVVIPQRHSSGHRTGGVFEVFSRLFAGEHRAWACSTWCPIPPLGRVSSGAGAFCQEAPTSGGRPWTSTA